MLVSPFTFSHQTFNFDKSEETWNLTLNRSEVSLTNLHQLQLLEVKTPEFLDMSYELMQDDTIQLTFSLPEAGVSFSSLAERAMSERLRLSLNILDLSKATAYPFGLILHPENLLITKDLRLKMAYRGLKGVMEPRHFNEDSFLRQVKCLIIDVFTGTGFSPLYDGSLEVIKLPSYLEQVRLSENLEELSAYLHQLYQEELAKESRSQIRVSKTRFRIYKQATIWLSALSVLLIVPLVYLIFFRGPFQSKLLTVDRAFLTKDYSQVIENTESIALDKLPYTQKYEAAYAYVQGLDFSDTQREVVMNNISLKSDELYLDYWVMIGRGKHDDALDTAKRLDDVDLILYALAENITATRKNSDLSGEERSEKLQSLQSEYDQYWKEREDALGEDDKEDKGLTSSQPSNNSSSGSQSSSKD